MGSAYGVRIKVLGDGSITEVATGFSKIICGWPADNVDDTAAITDIILSTTNSGTFDTAIDATATAIANGTYRCFFLITTM